MPQGKQLQRGYMSQIKQTGASMCRTPSHRGQNNGYPQGIREALNRATVPDGTVGSGRNPPGGSHRLGRGSAWNLEQHGLLTTTWARKPQAIGTCNGTKHSTAMEQVDFVTPNSGSPQIPDLFHTVDGLYHHELIQGNDDLYGNILDT